MQDEKFLKLAILLILFLYNHYNLSWDSNI